MKKLEKIGLTGTIITAICCFTPVLVILLSAVGFTALTYYLDFVLWPLLLFFVVMTIVGFVKK